MSPSILNCNWTGTVHLIGRFLLLFLYLLHLNIAYWCFLAGKVSADSLMKSYGSPLICNKLFFLLLTAFKIPSLALILNILFVICPGLGPLGTCYLKSLGFLDLDVYFFFQVRGVFPFSLLLLRPPIIWMLFYSMLSHRSLTISSLFNYLFFLLAALFGLCLYPVFEITGGFFWTM